MSNEDTLFPTKRRDVMRMPVLAAMFGTATTGVASTTATADSEPDEPDEPDHILEVYAKGGKISEYYLVGGEEGFEIRYEDLGRGGTIATELWVDVKEIESEDIVGATRIREVTRSGRKEVKIEDFPNDGDMVGVSSHSAVYAGGVGEPNSQSGGRQLSVDLDAYDPDDDFKHTTTFDITVEASIDSLGSNTSVRDRRLGRDTSNISTGRPDDIPGRPDNTPGRPDHAGRPDNPGQSDDDDRGRPDNPGNGNNSQPRLADQPVGSADNDDDPTVIDSDVVQNKLEVNAILGAGIAFGKQFGVAQHKEKLPQTVNRPNS